MTWLVRNLEDAGHQVLTCDKPLVVHSGLYDSKSLLALPLSPTHAFFAAHDEATLNNVARARATKLVSLLNSDVAKQAMRLIVGDAEHRFIQRHLPKAAGGN